MTKLDAVSKLIENINHQFDSFPPVHRWHPETEGEIDITINRDGEWFHEGSRFERDALVRLFSSVLRKDGDHYFLVTPVEKLKISVECLPFVAVAMVCMGEGDEQTLFFTTNTGDRVMLTGDASMIEFPHGGQQLPAIQVRDNLYALIHRNVYYELAERAECNDEGQEAVIVSAGQRYRLPAIDN